MKITDNQLQLLKDFISDQFIEDEWFLRHTEIGFDDRTHTIIITIDNVNDQEYGWLKEGGQDGSIHNRKSGSG